MVMIDEERSSAVLPTWIELGVFPIQPSDRRAVESQTRPGLIKKRQSKGIPLAIVKKLSVCRLRRIIQ